MSENLQQLSEISGLKLETIKDLFESAKLNQARLKSCLGHKFTINLTPPEKKLGSRWKCSRCDGEVDVSAKTWYDLGLIHGASKWQL